MLSLVWMLPAMAAELIMVEQPGCVWCERWDEEIGGAYPKTEEGRVAPLRRVDITDGWPEDLAGVARERLTPTFILVSDGVEIDRLRGYPGEHFFWPLLSAMLEKLPEKIN
ncbi:transcriptional regulator [Labrenzia sp. VG12]|nr:transcriptional regulator [Labrenzia sp. VG12]